MKRSLSLMMTLCLSGLVTSGYSPSSHGSAPCDVGYEMSRVGDFQHAVPILDTCISSGETSPETRRLAYQARAWAKSNLGDVKAALQDHEASLQIAPAVAYHEFINYASYLRAVGRTEDSLAPLKFAESIDKSANQANMMTQYNLGWTLQELGRHDEAIAAFNRGIPEQPDYAFVYYRRGLSLEAIGRKDAARADFEKTAGLIHSQEVEKTAGKYLPQVRAKLAEYGIQ